MDYNYNGTPQSNNSSSNSQAFGVASTTLSVMSLFMLCVPWLSLVLAAAGLTCGIIAWIQIKKIGGAVTPLPIIGTIISSVTLIISLVIVISLYFAINELNVKYQEFDSTYQQMRDSLYQWNSQLDYEDLPEADSTLYIDN
ncbi:MAG: hypothetical protein K6F33_05565 [Bacteroidales bacterium]|nr:hypothetical protein [Bacteroidales bacterium]